MVFKRLLQTIQYRRWMIPKLFVVRVCLLVLLLIWCFWMVLGFGLFEIGRARESFPVKQKREAGGDEFCLDRYGRPITREEVQMSKQINVSNKEYFMTIAIPTIQRRGNGKNIVYLDRTLRSLLSKLSDDAKKETVIIILCADEDLDARNRTFSMLQESFANLLENGLIRVIQVPARFYHSLENLPRTLNDTQVRMKWRSKQSLDYAFMFYYCHGLAKYHLQIEDDIEFDRNFYKVIKHDVLNSNSPWIVYQYFAMGFIGKIFKSTYLVQFANIFRIYYFEMPVDILYFRSYIFLGFRDRAKIRSPYLFHHIGKQSSSKNHERN